MTCNGGTTQNCLSCLITKYLYVTDTVSGSGICLICNPLCKTCKGTTSLDCLSCYPGTYLYNYGCLTYCPSNSIGIVDTCYACHSSCKTCSGINPYDCLTCFDGYYQKNGYCQKCDPTCNTCTMNFQNVSYCTSCKANAVLVYESCICQDGYYCFGTNCSDNCIKCDPSCKTCYAFPCLSCFQGFFLYEHTCIQNCPSPFINDVVNNNCSLCDPTCLTCKGSTNSDCLTCNSSYVLSDGSCVNQCPSNQYLNLTTRNCLLSRIIDVNFNIIAKNFIYEIELSEEWPFLAQNANSYINVEVSSLNNQSYTYFIQNNSNKLIWIYLEYTGETPPNNSKISIQFISQSIDKTFILNSTAFSDIIVSICKTNFYFDKSKEKIIYLF